MIVWAVILSKHSLLFPSAVKSQDYSSELDVAGPHSLQWFFSTTLWHILIHLFAYLACSPASEWIQSFRNVPAFWSSTILILCAESGTLCAVYLSIYPSLGDVCRFWLFVKPWVGGGARQGQSGERARMQSCLRSGNLCGAAAERETGGRGRERVRMTEKDRGHTHDRVWARVQQCSPKWEGRRRERKWGKGSVNWHMLCQEHRVFFINIIGSHENEKWAMFVLRPI